MLSRLVILTCSFFCLTFIFTGCSDSSVTSTGTINTLDTGNFTYPFKDGSTWNYTRKYSASNFRPDSLRRYFSDYPVLGNGTTTILYDTVINGITTKCFLETYTENSRFYSTRNYFASYDSGLICYGYRNPFGANFGPFKVSGGIRFQWKNFRSVSLRDLLYTVENGTMVHSPSSSITGDSMYLENPPVMCVKYPVVTGTEWFFKSIYPFDEIHKKYTGFERILNGSNFYSAMKTQRIWTSMPDLMLYDYYSKFGILKRDYTTKNIMVINEFGTIIGYVDFNDLYLVTSFNIPSE